MDAAEKIDPELAAAPGVIEIGTHRIYEPGAYRVLFHPLDSGRPAPGDSLLIPGIGRITFLFTGPACEGDSAG